MAKTAKKSNGTRKAKRKSPSTVAKKKQAENEKSSNLLKHMDESDIRPSEVANLMASYSNSLRFLRHELHGPICSISGFAQLLSMELPTDCDLENPFKKPAAINATEMAECLKYIQDSGRDLIRVLDYFVEIREGAELGSITEAVSVAANALTEISVSIERSSSLDLEILFPFSLLSQVFKELFQNSIRHGGATEVKVSWEDLDGAIRMIVEDDGTGFSQIKNGDTELFAGSVCSSNRSGISLTNAVIHILDGAMTVSNCSVLGGARITMILKPKIYWINGSLRKIKR
ncbi:MAG: sensor histidine kinase [Verrucomicrobiae bacterium]|nr:sensor histidine kinase [Verrucomicrobiae bacterium]